MKPRIAIRKIPLLTISLLLPFLFIANPVSAATYSYDNLGRLISVTNTSGTSCSYSYDAGGNILSIISQSSLGVMSTNPENQAVNVPVYQTIEIRFNMDLEQDINFAGISLMAGEDSISVTDSVYADTIFIDPINDLAENTTYQLFIPAAAVKSTSGAVTNNEINLQFTTTPTSLNMLTSDPTNNATVVPVSQSIIITFNQNIQAGDNYANISLNCEGQPVSINYSISGNTLTIDPVSDLEGNKTYILVVPAGAIKKINDMSSNLEINIQFTTG